MKAERDKKRGFILAITAAILWGVSGSFAQFLFEYRGINIEWLVTVRLLISGIILIAIAAIRKDPDVWLIWKNRKDAFQLVLFSILGMLAVQYTYFAAIKYSNAATATVLQYAGPVIIAIYLALKNRKWPSPMEYLAIFLAITGTFLLVTHGSLKSLSISGLALFWGIASAVALAFYSMYPLGLLKRYSATVVIGWAMFSGGIAFSFVHVPWQVGGTWDDESFLFTAFIILLGSLTAFYAYLTSVKLIGPQTTSLLASAEPLSAAIIAVLWLNVIYESMDWLGSLFIISTIFLLAKTGKTRKTEVLVPQSSELQKNDKS